MAFWCWTSRPQVHSTTNNKNFRTSRHVRRSFIALRMYTSNVPKNVQNLPQIGSVLQRGILPKQQTRVNEVWLHQQTGGWNVAEWLDKICNWNVSTSSWCRRLRHPCHWKVAQGHFSWATRDLLKRCIWPCFGPTAQLSMRDTSCIEGPICSSAIDLQPKVRLQTLPTTRVVDVDCIFVNIYHSVQYTIHMDTHGTYHYVHDVLGPTQGHSTLGYEFLWRNQLDLRQLLNPKCRRSWYSFTIMTPKLTHVVYHNALCSLDDVTNINPPTMINKNHCSQTHQKTETQRQASNGQGHRWVLADISNTSIRNVHDGVQ